MIPRSVKTPTIPIPFHKLLKIVAIVDPSNAQTRELPDDGTVQFFRTVSVPER